MASNPFDNNQGDADLFKQLTRVKRKDGADDKEGHISPLVHEGFEGLLTEVMSAGNLSKNRQNAQMYRLRFVVDSVQSSIPEAMYDNTTFGKIQAVASNVVTKVSQSAEGSGNLMKVLKTAFSITQTSSRHEEQSKISGRVK